MANSSQAAKRSRQAEKRRQRNASARSMMRTYMKKVNKAIEAGSQEQAQLAYKAATPVIDSMVTKGLVHKNKAARHKSRLNRRIQALGS